MKKSIIPNGKQIKKYIADRVIARGHILLCLLLTGALFPSLTAQVYTFSYTGGQQVIFLQAGNHRVQCWGAVGGDNMAATTGGLGGYSTGTVNIPTAGNYYVYVGGKGITGVSLAASALGGFNGGGTAGAYSSASGYGMGSGGGATHIASATGLLSTLSGNQSAVVIVAGGGGGAGSNNGPTNLINNGGNGGGIAGGNGASGNPTYGGTGGNQTTGGFGNMGNGTFGQGGNNSGNNTGGGGGGGWYGGGAAQWEGSGGGSGYIGGVTNGTTAATAQTGFVANPVTTGDGYAIITGLCPVTASAAKNPICFGETVALTTNAASGIVWGQSGSTANTINVSPAVNTTYTVTGQALNGCSSTILITVTVNPLPALSAATIPTVLCVGKSATITASGANSYTWATGSVIAPTTAVNPVVTSNFNFSGTNQYGCVNSAVVSVVVNTNVLGVPANTTICTGNSINLMASGAQSYTWSTGIMFQTLNVAPVLNTVYTVGGTDSYGCVLTNMVSVNLFPQPTVTLFADKGLYCRGENVVLTAGGANTYSWSSGASTGAVVTYNLPVDIAYVFSVTGTDGNGCTNTATVNITAGRCLGVNETTSVSELINVYPNPSNGIFNVSVGSVTNNLKLSVYNELGQLVQKQLVLSVDSKIDLQREKSGIYFIHLSDQENNTLKVVKLIKE